MLNSSWKSSAEWRELKQREQAAYRTQRYEEKYNNSPPVQIPQSWRGKNTKLKNTNGVMGKV